jgi:pyrimidine-nucleoside phosphorylase
VSLPTFLELIERKRDGHEHSSAEIERLVCGFVAGEMPDYQMSAWLMAVVLRGLSADETVAMTDAMVRSGDVLDLAAVPGVKVDKHSTGGVADTTTLVLAPLVAACGVPVAKMSGRGLGHTGGTLDKLEAIPGFRTQLEPAEFLSQVQSVGVAVVAQSPTIDPADKMIYALRDVTGTVPSIPLIVSSIISKKIAGGADAIVIDVKVGSGAFMKTEAEARQLAHELATVGATFGRKVECLMSDMSQPLGMSVGNSLEVAEAVQTLRGNGPAELTALCLVLGAKMLILAEKAANETQAMVMLGEAIADGRALQRFAEWIEAQGGDPRIVEDPSLLPQSACAREVLSTQAGWVARVDAEGVGRVAMLLGAGRMRVDDAIDLGAGVVLAVRVGDWVEKGALLCTLHAASERLLVAGEERVRHAIHIGSVEVSPPLLFHQL